VTSPVLTALTHRPRPIVQQGFWTGAMVASRSPPDYSEGMIIYALSDPHLGRMVDKPMDVFGDHWEDHGQKIFDHWDAIVRSEDLVLVPGDISWAMKPAEARPDLEDLNTRPGRKLLTKGNHDYWWPNKKRDFVLPGLDSMRFLHGRTFREGPLGIAATRAWKIPGDSWWTEHDDKIYKKELRFLETALQELGDAELRLCMLHYPPFNDRKEPGDFVDLLKRYRVQHVIHGHLHGPDSAEHTVTGLHDGIHYHLTSCDHLGFKPVPILSIPDDL